MRKPEIPFFSENIKTVCVEKDSNGKQIFVEIVRPKGTKNIIWQNLYNLDKNGNLKNEFITTINHNRDEQYRADGSKKSSTTTYKYIFESNTTSLVLEREIHNKRLYNTNNILVYNGDYTWAGVPIGLHKTYNNDGTDRSEVVYVNGQPADLTNQSPTEALFKAYNSNTNDYEYDLKCGDYNKRAIAIPTKGNDPC